MMKTRKLGWTDLALSTVGLGTNAMGGLNWAYSWGYQDDKASIATILQSLELGVNWIDTAPLYGLGHAEEIVGRAIKGLTHKPIIATKCGVFLDENWRTFNRIKRESILAEVEGSLRRVGVEAIDLYHVHWPIPDEDIEEAWETIAKLVKEGKVRYTAASNFNVSQLKRIQAIHPVAAVQNPYSMIERELEKEVLDYCGQHNIGIVVWGPLAHGLLTDKFSRERLQNLDQKDSFRRNTSQHFKEPEVSLNLELVQGLKPIARRLGLSLVQLAITWILRRPEITSAIVGARKPSQIEETAAAGDRQLSEEDFADIASLIAQREKKLSVS
jgi:aryl-alcohol dehydrogenase-like predicted oxidoreductase